MQPRRSQASACPSFFRQTFCRSPVQLVHLSPHRFGPQLCQMPQQLTKRMHKTKQRMPHSSVETRWGIYYLFFCVRPIMFGADYGVSTHPRSPGWLRWASGIVTRQAGWWPPGPGRSWQKRGQRLHLFAAERDYRS